MTNNPKNLTCNNIFVNLIFLNQLILVEECLLFRDRNYLFVHEYKSIIEES